MTNDDGIHAPGLWALVRAVKPLGNVLVCAPDRDRSGVGASLSDASSPRVKRLFAPVEGVEAHAVDGTPGDATLLGLRQLASGPVDLVVSGINPGNNVSADIERSGTVGAGLHACINGVPALAVSSHSEPDADAPLVTSVITEVAREMLKGARRPPLFLNLNFPLIDAETCHLHDHAVPAAPIAGAVRTAPAPLLGLGDLGSAGSGDPLPSDSDVAALVDGYISLTPLDQSLSVDGASAAVHAVVRRAAHVASKFA